MAGPNPSSKDALHVECPYLCRSAFQKIPALHGNGTDVVSVMNKFIPVIPIVLRQSKMLTKRNASMHLTVYGTVVYIYIHRVAQWLRCCTTNRKVAGSIPGGVREFFIDIKSFRSPYGPGIDSVSNRNDYQEYFLGVKAAGA